MPNATVPAPPSSSRPLSSNHIRLLRLEAAATLVLAVATYASSGGAWWWFLAVFLVPDVSMLGYLLSPTAGAFAYNLAHTHVAPFVLLVAAGLGGAVPSITTPEIAFDARHAEVLLHLAIVWIAHVAFDRTLGYGLKHADGFVYTHLGTIGGFRRRPDSMVQPA